ncbi:hypothetical protein C8J56DRAFT_728153, partial [Mycena floridula]
KSQYKVQVSCMPKTVVKRLDEIQHAFVWGEGKSSPIGKDILASRIESGGKSMRMTETRNEATDIMHLKTYLQLGEDRPTWAYVADTLIQRHRNVTDGVKEDSCSNMFLQKWNTAPFRLPLVLYNMLSTAKKYGIEFNGTCLSIDTLNEIPIWHHLGGDPEKTQYNNRATDLCLRSVHKVFT